MRMMSMKVFEEIEKERAKQHLKFCYKPIANSTETVSIMGEKFGEICHAVNQNLGEEETRKEVVQLAAVCIAWLDNDLHFGPKK